MSYDPSSRLIGRAPLFVEVLRPIESIAAIDAPVLVEGETGTGKELVARAMHYCGPRGAMPFIPANCGGLPDTLIENEFFGHVRGAYTDAREPQPGLIAQAQGGTLFLDEVESLPMRGQVALLRFLQDFRYRPLGATRDQLADVRIVAATNANLEDVVAQKQFRADLYYRLKIFSVKIPALRERPGDPELLARHFIALYASHYGIECRRLSAADVAWLERHPWPGNVRELENLVHRAVVQSRGRSAITLAPLAAQRASAAQPEEKKPAVIAGWEEGFQRAKAAAVEEFERSYIARALTESRGNVSAAARLSGKERRAFGKLMKKHGLGKPLPRP
jgi:DNA-binding NtrC family response regulator